jgi:pyruvate kinase
VPTIALKNKAKIIATLGPQSASPAMLKALVQAGANVFRLNLSHGDWPWRVGVIQSIRALSAELDRPIGILGDLQGPKIRTANLTDGQPIALGLNETVWFSTAYPTSLGATEGHPSIIATNYKPLLQALTIGEAILIDDGKIRLVVTARINDDTLECTVVESGILLDRKGINVPHTTLAVSAMSPKDEADIVECLRNGLDFIALSFVQKGDDMLALRDFISQHQADLGTHRSPVLIAKIEKPQALLDLHAIIEASDALMVARGDLGVEVSLERVPTIQKNLVQLANMARKPVIIATQMLESMILAPHPTRAEVSDVANGVYDGADALMLSGETASGAFPVEAITTMRQIIEEAEEHTPKQPENAPMYRKSQDLAQQTHIHYAIAHSACYALDEARASAVVVFSTSGSMARRVSKLKPPKPIIALTADPQVYQQLSLLWGVTPLVVPFEETTDLTLARAEDDIVSRGLLQPGDTFVFCAGSTPLYGVTNMLRIDEIRTL